MKLEEAIETINIHLAYTPLHTMPKTKEALDMAIAALREQSATDTNDGHKTEAKDWPPYMDLPRKKEDHVREITNMVGWISVEDRLPEPNTLVLVVFKRHDEIRRRGFGTLQTHGVWYVSNEGMPPVTHWMPLPELPEEENYGTE